jgi:2-polyprenyl-3-methyl-5-hydroxy-6-metoxy-1,4-benzoquinol methylase
MDSAYAEAYPELYRRHWWWRVREEILIKRISALFDDRTRPLRILDVGCGAGLFFDALRHFGHVEGIESDASAVGMSGKWRHRIFHGELDARYRPAEPYDLILLLDVLEHLEDPEALLGHSRELLKPEGRVLVTVPAFNFLWTSHDDLNRHVTRYTAGQMRRTVEAAALVPIDSTYLFQSLVFPKALVGLRERIGGSQASIPAIPPPRLNALLQTWLRAEYRFARWVGFGASLLMVARRRG